MSVSNDKSFKELETKKLYVRKVLLIACGAVAQEIINLKTINGWQHLELTCLPAKLHLYPEKIAGAVREAVVKHRASYESIFVVYADCGTGGDLQKTCTELGVEMVPGPHCYSFFEGNSRFASLDETTTFYLTDFLVRQFDAFVVKPMGLDKHPELRDMYFGNYEKLVYQAQTDDGTLTKKAKAAAKQLGLKFERRFTGYGDLQKILEKK